MFIAKYLFPTLWFAFSLFKLCLKKVKLLILMWCNLFIFFLTVGNVVVLSEKLLNSPSSWGDFPVFSSRTFTMLPTPIDTEGS